MRTKKRWQQLRDFFWKLGAPDAMPGRVQPHHKHELLQPLLALLHDALDQLAERVDAGSQSKMTGVGITRRGLRSDRFELGLALLNRSTSATVKVAFINSKASQGTSASPGRNSSLA